MGGDLRLLWAGECWGLREETRASGIHHYGNVMVLSGLLSGRVVLAPTARLME